MNGPFEDVVDFCERHLETTRGREIGMTFGAAISALGRVAAHPSDTNDPLWRQLNRQRRSPGADRFATTNFDRKRVATFPSFGRLLRFWFPSS